MSSEDRRYEYMQKLSHELDMQQDEIDQERKRLIREQQEAEDYFQEVRIALNEELDKLPRRFSSQIQSCIDSFEAEVRETETQFDSSLQYLKKLRNDVYDDYIRKRDSYHAE